MGKGNKIRNLSPNIIIHIPVLEKAPHLQSQLSIGATNWEPTINPLAIDQRNYPKQQLTAI